MKNRFLWHDFTKSIPVTSLNTRIWFYEEIWDFFVALDQIYNALGIGLGSWYCVVLCSKGKASYFLAPFNRKENYILSKTTTAESSFRHNPYVKKSKQYFYRFWPRKLIPPSPSVVFNTFIQPSIDNDFCFFSYSEKWFGGWFLRKRKYPWHGHKHRVVFNGLSLLKYGETW